MSEAGLETPTRTPGRRGRKRASETRADGRTRKARKGSSEAAAVADAEGDGVGVGDAKPDAAATAADAATAIVIATAAAAAAAPAASGSGSGGGVEDDGRRKGSSKRKLSGAIADGKEGVKKVTVDFKADPKRAERAVVHVQFPKDRDMPSRHQIHVFLLKKYPNFVLDKIMPQSRDHKMTIIFPSAHIAQEGSNWFMERGPAFFHVAEGSIFTAFSGFVPGGTKTQQRESAEGQKPGDSIRGAGAGGGGALPAANYIIPAQAAVGRGIQNSIDSPIPSAVMPGQAHVQAHTQALPQAQIQIPAQIQVPQYVAGAAPFSATTLTAAHVGPNMTQITWAVGQGTSPSLASSGPDLNGIPQAQLATPMHHTTTPVPSPAQPVMNDNPLFNSTPPSDPRIKMDIQEAQPNQGTPNMLGQWMEKGPDPGEGPSQW